jgi:hypothetical protein
MCVANNMSGLSTVCTDDVIRRLVFRSQGLQHKPASWDPDFETRRTSSTCFRLGLNEVFVVL